MANWLYYGNGGLTHQPPTVSVYDTGFLQGVTVSEQLRTFRGQLFRLERHWDRLRRSLEIVGVELPETWRALTEIAQHLADHNYRLLHPDDDLSLTVLITPGTSSSLLAPVRTGAVLILHAQPIAFENFATRYQEGERLVVSSVRQVSSASWPAELKCRSRMHYYLADREARHRDPSARALLLDVDGFVSEASTANVFTYSQQDGCRCPSRGKILSGVSLEFLMELLAEMQVPFRDGDMTRDDFCRADEVLLCSTSPCVLPVTVIDGHAVGDGRPGPLFHRLLEAWGRHVGLDIAEQALRFSHRPSRDTAFHA